jgi:hypothetical protein
MQRFTGYAQCRPTYCSTLAKRAEAEQMEADRASYQLQLFTLQLWQEAVSEGQYEWRGAIKNTSTGEVRYFREWEALVDLVPAMLQAAGAGDDTGDAGLHMRK